MSTETALHKVTFNIEKALEVKQFALAVFLDISGAFSNAAISSMVRFLAQKGVERDIIKWIACLLSKRTATAQIGNIHYEREITTGVAEGGIISPDLFNNVVSDGIVKVLNNSTVDCNGYADDIMTLKSGPNLTILAEQTQVALNILADWAQEHNLSFNADKTKAMVFTTRYKYEKPVLTINGKAIEYVDSFKYLGIIFDKRLSWTEHIKTQAKKAKAALMVSKRMVGKHWGLNPKTTHWAYTAIVRPLLTYGAIIWAPGINKKGNNLILTRIQRLACKMVTSGMHSTPTAGMEILLELRPIEMEIKAAALSSGW